jgi:tRNA(fMet)-specific endonuclease VapC
VRQLDLWYHFSSPKPQDNDIDDAAAQQFAKLLTNPKLRKIGRADMLIAAIALSTGYSLVTRNVKHFRNVPGLKVEDWMK